MDAQHTIIEYPLISVWNEMWKQLSQWALILKLSIYLNASHINNSRFGSRKKTKFKPEENIFAAKIWKIISEPAFLFCVEYLLCIFPIQYSDMPSSSVYFQVDIWTWKWLWILLVIGVVYLYFLFFEKNLQKHSCETKTSSFLSAIFWIRTFSFMRYIILFAFYWPHNKKIYFNL